MDMNRFTEKAQEALSAAQSKAIRYGHQQVDVEHLLVGPARAGARTGRIDSDTSQRRLSKR